MVSVRKKKTDRNPVEHKRKLWIEILKIENLENNITNYNNKC